jgi:hypothetical protein
MGPETDENGIHWDVIVRVATHKEGSEGSSIYQGGGNLCPNRVLSDLITGEGLLL